MNSWTLLQAAGLTVNSQAMASRGADALFEVSLDGIEITLAFESRSRAPYPNEVPALEERRMSLADVGVPTLMTRYISEPTGSELTNAGWSWIDSSGNADIRAPGARIQRRTDNGPPRRPARTLPASWSVIRTLIETTTDSGVTHLAEVTGVSQPRASQILTQLADLGFIEKTGRSTWITDRAALLEAFLEEYPGPGGMDQWWFSLDPPTEVAAKLLVAHPKGLVSGDVAADRLAPWGTPTTTTLYAFDQFEMAAGLVEAEGPGDGNVRITYSEDKTVRSFPSLPRDLVRPSQVIWDLHHDGDDTRRAAANRVIEWVLNR